MKEATKHALKPGFKILLLLSFYFVLICLISQAAKAQSGIIKIKVDPQAVVSHISSDFIGLGYETSAVAQANYFSPKNTKLVNLYRNLSPHGLIRIGGIISDHTKYVPDGISEVQTQNDTTFINHTDLIHLAEFARATGWKVMWGLNLGTGSKEQAVQEAKAVHATLGNDLQSFQIGNEVDLHHLYNKSYKDFDSYYADYLAYKTAIRKALPRAPFSGPDVAGNLAWLKAFANKEAGDIKLLTHHYYRTGSKKPEATIKTLLSKDVDWHHRLNQLQQISHNKNVPYRINEVNSFYGGGKAGVSDTFASALWCLNYMFVLASYDCNGVNMETDINQLGWISHYSPIVHDSAGNCSVRPEYYGMLAFSLAGNGDLVKLTMDKTNINLSAYATKDNSGYLWITLVNKDLEQNAKVEITLPEAYEEATSYWLKAPSVKNKDEVTLAGAPVSADGTWTPRSLKKMEVKNGNTQLMVPQTSAVLLRFQQQ